MVVQQDGMGLTHLRCSEKKKKRNSNTAHAIAEFLQNIHQSHMTDVDNVCTKYIYIYIILTQSQRHFNLFCSSYTEQRKTTRNVTIRSVLNDFLELMVIFISYDNNGIDGIGIGLA